MGKRARASTKGAGPQLFLNRSRSWLSIDSVNEFQRLIRYERARSDRESSALAVAVFDIGHGNGSGSGRGSADTPETLVAALKRAVRATDHLGWYDRQRIGVILPCTTEDQAVMFTTKVQRTLPDHLDPASVQVYSYQDGWLKRRTKRSGGGGGDVKNAKRVEGLDLFCPPGRGEEWSPNEPLEDLFARKMPSWKRILDITVSVVGLLVLAPVLLIVGIYIKLVSPGPIIFKQKRVGYRGRPFDFYKFRTMKEGNDQTLHGRHAGNFIRKGSIPMTKLDDSDPRIIRGGKILRKAAIDELPQLFCVLKGDMSLVGPRPCIVYEAEEYLRWHTNRFDIAPGITGLWQVNGKNDLSFKEMIRLDINYSRNMSLLLDLKVLAATIPAIAGELRKAIGRSLGRT